MSKIKTDYARYTFAFASDVQKLADEKHVKITSFNTKQTKSHSGKSYDLLSVRFLVARPDRDEKKFDLEAEIAELEADLNTDEESEKEEVNS